MVYHHTGPQFNFYRVWAVHEPRRHDRQFAGLPDAPTAYIDTGAGPALVMVHGVGLNASVWAPQLAEFEGDFRVVAYDTLGHGRSALPRPVATLDDYVDQLHRLLDHLGLDQVALLGHSMGALVIASFAIACPERVAALIAANSVYRRPEHQLAISGGRARRLERDGPAAILDETLSRWFGDEVKNGSPQIEQVRRWISRVDRRGYARAYRVFSEADPWLDGRIGELRKPALFITGELDPNSTPGMTKAMAEAAPLGRAVVLPGERHMMAYISSHRFNPVVRGFLDETATTSSGMTVDVVKRVEQA